MIVVVDYDAGNLRSVETALEYVGAAFTITADPDMVASADKVIVPGVGDGAHAMSVLEARGLDRAIRDVFSQQVPILGICLGSQIVLEHTEERDASCLGLIPGRARAFRLNPSYKVPHMGWNQVHYTDGHWLFAGVPQNAAFYFVHSYYPDPTATEDTLAVTEYGIHFASAVHRGSLVAVQFHPEKSGEAGLQLLRNFVNR